MYLTGQRERQSADSRQQNSFNEEGQLKGTAGQQVELDWMYVRPENLIAVVLARRYPIRHTTGRAGSAALVSAERYGYDMPSSARWQLEPSGEPDARVSTSLGSSLVRNY